MSQHLDDTGLSMAQDFTSQLQLVVCPNGEARWWLREKEERHEELPSLCSVLLKNGMRVVTPAQNVHLAIFSELDI